MCQQRYKAIQSNETKEAERLAAVDVAVMADRDLSATWEPTVERLRATQADALQRLLADAPEDVRARLQDLPPTQPPKLM